VAGEILLTAMNIPLSAFQISGGIILFVLALTMIFGENKRDEEAGVATSGTETAIFPLAVPSIAGPGAILTAVLLTENHRFDIWQQVQVAGVMLSVLVIVLVLMLAAKWIHRLIGTAGASILKRVMGLILASLATTNVLTGIKLYLPTLS